MKDDYVRLVISDLHLGAAYSNEIELYEFLTSVEFVHYFFANQLANLFF